MSASIADPPGNLLNHNYICGAQHLDRKNVKEFYHEKLVKRYFKIRIIRNTVLFYIYFVSCFFMF